MKIGIGKLMEFHRAAFKQDDGIDRLYVLVAELLFLLIPDSLILL